MNHSTKNYGNNKLGEIKALNNLIADFSEHLRVKLESKTAEGKSGWDDPNWPIEDIEFYIAREGYVSTAERIKKGEI